MGARRLDGKRSELDLEKKGTTMSRAARSASLPRAISLAAVSLCMFSGGAAMGASAALAESCPNEASRQGPSIELTQCRAYEQVTPTNKGDAIDIFVGEGLEAHANERAFVAEDGNVLLKTASSIGPQAPTLNASYVFSRGAHGWSTSALAAPTDEVQAVTTEVFDPADLSAVGFSDLSGVYGDLIGGRESEYLKRQMVGPTGGPYTTLASQTGFGATTFADEEVELDGGSEDLSLVILESQNHSLAPGAEGQDSGSDSLYESSGGQLRLVNVNNEGELLSPCGANLGQGSELGGGESGGDHTAVSSDGSKVFFTSPAPNAGGQGGSGPGCWNAGTTPEENPPELYMREGGERTVEISKSEEGMITAENPLRPAVFVGASADGSKVFFLSSTELTKDDTGHATELYMYDTDTGHLTRVSRGESGVAEGQVHYAPAISSDGSAVYFVAGGKLTAEAQAGADNLYRYDTLTGTTTYITAVNDTYPDSLEGERGNWYNTTLGTPEEAGSTWEGDWYTTGDGQYLVFASQVPITGFDNEKAPGVDCNGGASGDGGLDGSGNPGEPCLEMFRYEAATNRIICVSCVGGLPTDEAMFTRTAYQSPAVGPPRPISEDGKDVFFDSASALVPQAAPGREHVYEWHDGTLSMISSPEDPGNAFFLGSSTEGKDVIFSTHAQLAPQDTDQSDDIYDARVDGGFGGLAPAQCTGTGCQGLPAAPPIFATPSSVTFAGVGNFAPGSGPSGTSPRKVAPKPKKCKRGYAKKHGRCVRKKAKKSAKERK